MAGNRQKQREIRGRMKRTGEPYNVAKRAVEAEHETEADDGEGVLAPIRGQQDGVV